MKHLQRLTSEEKAVLAALIERVLGSVEPTFTPRDDYYRDVLERVAESMTDLGAFDIAPYMVRKQVLETAREHGKKAFRSPAA